MQSDGDLVDISILFYLGFINQFTSMHISPLKVYSVLSKYPHRIVRVNGGVGLYAKISDDTLEKLVSGKITLNRAEALMSDDGDNTHFLMVVADGVGALKRMADKVGGKTISWFVPDRSRLVIKRRGLLCHS